MKLLGAALVVLTLSGCAGLNPERSLTQAVQAEGGLVSGTGTDVFAFRGNPYAKAPVGALRWREPQAAPAWSGVRDGSKFDPDCMQPKKYSELRGAGMSEDCLSVNVWTNETYFEFGANLLTESLKPSSRLDLISDFYAQRNR